MADSGRSGFTLVEMLVALAVSALLALLLVQSLQATGLLARRTRQMSAQDDVTVVREHLRRLFSEAVRRRGDGGRVPFLGLGDRVVARVAADRAAERGAELQVEVAAGASPGRQTFALVERRSLVSTMGQPDEPDILLDGIAGLRLRYFGIAAQGEPAGWHPTWSRGNRLPALLEVAVDFPAEDRRRWPALVVPLGPGA